MNKRVRHLAYWVTEREWLVALLTLAWAALLSLLLYWMALHL
jgi:hypothetical protein